MLVVCPVSHLCQFQKDCLHGVNHIDNGNCFRSISHCPDCVDVIKVRKNKIEKLNEKEKSILEDN
jgi:hypothetical protein